MTDQDTRRIVAEIRVKRRRQVTEHGYTAAHDDAHREGELAMAAVCYAAPARVYELEQRACGFSLIDPWHWAPFHDARAGKGDTREGAIKAGSNMPPDPSTYSHAERRALLVTAGAFIVAEIERLDRLGPESARPVIGEDGARGRLGQEDENDELEGAPKDAAKKCEIRWCRSGSPANRRASETIGDGSFNVAICRTCFQLLGLKYQGDDLPEAAEVHRRLCVPAIYGKQPFLREGETL